MRTLRVVLLGLIVSALMAALPMTAKAQDVDPEDIKTLKEAVDALFQPNNHLAEDLNDYIYERTNKMPTGSIEEQKMKLEKNTKLLIDAGHALDKIGKTDLSFKLLTMAVSQEIGYVKKVVKNSKDPKADLEAAIPYLN